MPIRLSKPAYCELSGNERTKQKAERLMRQGKDTHFKGDWSER
jgi:hypothetical protein